MDPRAPSGIAWPSDMASSALYATVPQYAAVNVLDACQALLQPHRQLAKQATFVHPEQGQRSMGFGTVPGLKEESCTGLNGVPINMHGRTVDSLRTPFGIGRDTSAAVGTLSSQTMAPRASQQESNTKHAIDQPAAEHLVEMHSTSLPTHPKLTSPSKPRRQHKSKNKQLHPEPNGSQGAAGPSTSNHVAARSASDFGHRDPRPSGKEKRGFQQLNGSKQGTGADHQPQRAASRSPKAASLGAAAAAAAVRSICKDDWAGLTKQFSTNSRVRQKVQEMELELQNKLQQFTLLEKENKALQMSVNILETAVRQQNATAQALASSQDGALPWTNSGSSTSPTLRSAASAAALPRAASGPSPMFPSLHSVADGQVETSDGSHEQQQPLGQLLHNWQGSADGIRKAQDIEACLLELSGAHDPNMPTASDLAFVRNCTLETFKDYWKAYLQQASVLLLHIECPQPSSQAMATLDLLTCKVMADVTNMYLLNPLVLQRLKHYNLETGVLHPVSDQHWATAVSQVPLSDKQRQELASIQLVFKSMHEQLMSEVEESGQEMTKHMPSSNPATSTKLIMAEDQQEVTLRKISVTLLKRNALWVASVAYITRSGTLTMADLAKCFVQCYPFLPDGPLLLNALVQHAPARQDQPAL